MPDPNSKQALTRRRTFNLKPKLSFPISDWDAKNLVSFNVKEIISLPLSSTHLPNTHLQFLITIMIIPSCYFLLQWTSAVHPWLQILHGNHLSPLSLNQINWGWAFCIIISTIFLPSLPCSSHHGVCISCVAGLTLTALLNIWLFTCIPTPPFLCNFSCLRFDLFPKGSIETCDHPPPFWLLLHSLLHRICY